MLYLAKSFYFAFLCRKSFCVVFVEWNKCFEMNVVAVETEKSAGIIER